MEFVLKQYDDILLSFAANRTMDGVEISIISLCEEKASQLPLGMEPTNESLTRWLKHRTNQLLKPAPIFDNGLSLYCYAMDNELDSIAEQEKTLAPALYSDFDEVALHVAGAKQKQGLRRLLNFRFKKHSRYNLSDARLKALEAAVQRKARQLLESV